MSIVSRAITFNLLIADLEEVLKRGRGDAKG